MKPLLIFICALALPAVLHAQAVNKTWAGGAGNWSASNWSPGGTVPAAIDSAFITNASSQVTLDVTTTVHGLTINGSNSLLGVAGGASPQAITINGLFDLSLGTHTIGSGSAMTIHANGGWSFRNANGRGLDGVTLNLAAGQTAIHQDAVGGITSAVQNGTTINNAGTYEARSNGGFQNVAGASTFNNSGTFTRNVSTTGEWFTSMAFNNTGTVNVNTGTLRLFNGGTSSGLFNVSSGALLHFGNGATTTFTTAASFTGAGNVRFELFGSASVRQYDITGGTTVNTGTITFDNSTGGIDDIGAVNVTGGTANFNGLTSPTGFSISGGEANFTNPVALPAGATLSGGKVTISATKSFTIPGSVTWNGANLAGGGTFNFNGPVTMATGSPRLEGSVLNIAAGRTATNSNGGSGFIQTSNGAMINNAGLWDHTGNTGFFHAAGAMGAFNNTGTFTKRTNAGGVNTGILFNNSGTVNVQNASLNLNGGGTQSGAFNVSSASTLTLAGAQVFTGNPGFSGLGTVSFGPTAPLAVTDYSMGGTTVTSSTITFNNGAGNIGAVTVTGSAIANFNGTASPTAFSINGGTANFANHATIPNTGSASFSGGTVNIPAAKVFSTGGAVTWTGGTLGGGGTFVFNAGGTTSSGVPKLFGSVLNLPAGQTYVDSYNAGGGSVELRSGAVINNAGTWEYLGDRTIYNGLAPMSSFNNTGTFTKRNNTGSTVRLQIPFNNSGTVNASAGTLEFNGQLFTQSVGSLVLNGGSVKTLLPLAITGGSLTGGGNVLGGVTVTGGTVKPRGTLAIQDTDGGITKGDLTMSAASTLDVELGGTTAGTQHDSVTEAGNVAFARNGTLALRFKNGFQYSIAQANNFTLLTSNANTTGQFSNVSAGRITTADFKGTFAINAAGTTSVVLSDFQGYPDIDVEQPLATNLNDGESTVDYGVRTIGTPGVVKTFTVKNTGAADLTGLGISIDGDHAAEFAVTAAVPGAPSATVLPAGTMEFIITFTPTGSGLRTAVLHIASNDPNEAQFDIALTGTGNFAPVLNLPLADVEVEPTDIDGAIVNFTVTATDFEDDPDPTAIASPASGSQFPLGDSTVIVTATDSRGVTTTGTFIVRVLGGDPSATTIAPNAITINSATLRATVNPNHFATSVQFVMDGQPRNPPVNVPAGSSPVTVTFPVSGLEPGSAHTANVQAINATGQFIDGGTVNFTTLGGPPAVTTTTPTMITPTKARLTATVNPNDLPTTVSFYIGQQLLGTVNVPAGSSPQTVTFDYQQLIPGQAVTFNTIAINQLAQTGVSGDDLTFNLLPSNTTFGYANNFLWAANAGWVNTKPATSYGFRTGDTVCSGFLWGANIGWIHAGTGEPSNGIRYTNIGSDYGVNVMPDGTLRGYAWGQNIGWVNFESTGAPAVDLTTGQLTGYAWGQNIGWINLSTGTTTQLAILDTDNDGISDAWENDQANGNLATLGNPDDADGDGTSDLDEFAADTDPLDPDEQLRILTFERGAPFTNLVFTSRTTRVYQVSTSTTMTGDSWVDVGIGNITGQPVSTPASFPSSANPARFYRVETRRPLAGP